MASDWSALKIQLMGTGENSGTWGNVTNTNLGDDILGAAITGSADVTFASNNQTLTALNNQSSQIFRNLRLNLTGTTGGTTRTLTVPNIEKVYIVNNGCGDAVEVKNTSGANVSVPANKTTYVFSTGTGVVDAITHLSSLTLTSPLSIASGGTGSNAGPNVSTVTGVLPIANGGTGSNTGPNVSTVDGVLPVLNGGTGSNIGSFSGANITALNATNISTGTLIAARGGTGVNSPGTSGNVLISNGTIWESSAPPGYPAMAWVSFNGTGTLAVLGSGNVTQVNDNGPGDYTVVFTNSMPDGNYAACQGGRRDSIRNYMIAGTGSTAPTASQYNFETKATDFNTSIDYDLIYLSFFR